MWLEWRSDFKYTEPNVVALGMFDGVHVGHQALLSRCREAAIAKGLRAAVYTFSTHPQAIFSVAPGMLSTPGEKAYLMQQAGMDAVIMPPFTREIASMQPVEFIQDLRARIPFEHVVVGYNYTFSKNRSGDVELLTQLGREMGFEVDIVQPVQMEGEPISSTRVREALAKGDDQLAAKLLERFYSVAGRVETGKKLASKLGFPTANIRVPAEKVIPLHGVYATRIRVAGQWLDAVTNVGTNPTTDGDHAPIRIETHIPGFVGDIYGQWVRIAFVKRMRDELRFNSVEELRNVVQQDIRDSRVIHREYRGVYPQR